MSPKHWCRKTQILIVGDVYFAQQVMKSQILSPGSFLAQQIEFNGSQNPKFVFLYR